MIELERLAAADVEMPDNLELPEQLLFLTLRTLYQNYHAGSVNRERAKREKSRINVAYDKLKNEFKIVEHHRNIQTRLTHIIGDVYSCNCQNCKKLLNVFTGIDRQDIPQDVKELNALAERLREMVKERSDRNAELATVIDRVRWTLESDRTDTEKLERIKEIIK